MVPPVSGAPEPAASVVAVEVAAEVATVSWAVSDSAAAASRPLP